MVKPEISDGVCLLRLARPPLNTITLELLFELRSAIHQAQQDAAVLGVVITGDSHHFSAGADVNLFQQVRSSEDAVGLCQVFQTALQEIEDSSKPVAAALEGQVIGGALELAMACHFRVAGTGSRMILPEVKLGINPGAGGTQRLPRLVGPAAALRMLLKAEPADAERALAIGLVDAVCPSGQAATHARDWVLSSPAYCRTSQRTDKVSDAGARDAAFLEARASLSDARPEIIAPWKIIESVQVGLERSYEAGLLKEQQAFAECMETRATQNKIYLFFATRQTSKIPELAEAETLPVHQAAVVGMGSMGTDIAFALLLAGIPVVVLDQNESVLAQGLDRIRSSLQKRVALGKLPEPRVKQTIELISTTSQWEDLAAADLVIESVFEDVAVKRAVISQIESVCSSRTILASNTSTIPLDKLAMGMRFPDRLIGMHFFNPAHRMPLLEIVRRDTTPPEILATAIRVAKTLRKTPILVASREGFLVTRVFVPYVQEAFWLLQEGATAAAIDDAAVTFGFPMGPLVLMDMTGLDILAHSQRVLASALPRHGVLPPVAVGLVERGQLGQKTGAGVYRYDPGSRSPCPNDTTAEVITRVRLETGSAPRDIPQDEIIERLVLRLVNEAFYVVEEGVARSPSDVDVATVLGTGFPDFRGGVLKYANDLGPDRVRARLDELAGRLGERFSPCRLLQEMEGVT